MSSFKFFLIEEVYKKPSRLTELSKEEAIKLIKENCKKFLTYKTNIFRGSKSTIEYGVSDSNSLEHQPRVSYKQKTNIYTQWMDNRPEWQDFPKRSKSFVCTNSFYVAGDYGNVSAVFPYDDALIAGTPGDDIWFAFENVGISDLSVLQNVIYEVANRELGIELSPSANFNLIEETLKKITLSLVDGLSVQQRDIQILKETLTINSCNNVYELFEKCVVPHPGFQVAKVSDAGDIVDFPESREFYIQGKAVFINKSIYNEVMDEIFAGVERE